MRKDSDILDTKYRGQLNLYDFPRTEKDELQYLYCFGVFTTEIFC